MGNVDPFFDLVAQVRRIEDLRAIDADPVRYIVLDHAISPEAGMVEHHDGKRRRYVLVSPSVLDALDTVKYGTHAYTALSTLSGIPTYRREDLGDEWPDYVGAS